MDISKKIPTYFKPLLWSYDFKKLDPQKNEQDIVLNAINYGNLLHWSWIAAEYGKPQVSQIIKRSRPLALRPGARALAKIVFGPSDE